MIVRKNYFSGFFDFHLRKKNLKNRVSPPFFIKFSFSVEGAPRKEGPKEISFFLLSLLQHKLVFFDEIEWCLLNPFLGNMTYFEKLPDTISHSHITEPRNALVIPPGLLKLGEV